MEKIFVSPVARKELNEKFGSPNVSKALNFRSNSKMCREIRHMAMNEYSGQRMDY